MADEFWRDPNIDTMIKDIIDIFTNIEGVELVRLSGLTKRSRKSSGHMFLSSESLHNIIQKLKLGGLLNYQYIMICPHCNETSYQLIDQDITKPKLCDTCKVMYTLVDGTTLKRS